MSAAVQETFMNQRTPADPPPFVEKKSVGSALAPGIYVKTGKSADGPTDERLSAEPRKSFFRGVVVGIAIMIPLWTWLIIRFLR
jgi:hypothetical protein